MKIAVLGLGRMGAWFCKELSKEHTVAVFDQNPCKLESVDGVIRLTELAGLESFNPELLLNAVNLENTLGAFEYTRPHISAACILADVASVKAGIDAYYNRTGHRFVSLHPMFGPTFSDMASLREENAVIIRESDPQCAEFFKNFFERLGVRVYLSSFSEHDRMMAYSLTVPFILSLIFTGGLEQKPVPGTTFKKHLAIARSLLDEDKHLLAEILFNVHSIPALENIAGRLEFLKHLIMQKDYEEMRVFIDKMGMNLNSPES